MRNVGRDAEAMGVTAGVKIIEIPGCNSGWLAAATALAKDSDDSAPHLIYLPESGLDPAQFLADVEVVYRRLGYCLIVLSEGIKGKDEQTLPHDLLLGKRMGNICVNFSPTNSSSRQVGINLKICLDLQCSPLQSLIRGKR